MPQKIYKRIGLRRENNLADLSNAKEALNNLLDTLVDDVTASFITEDLEAINGIFSDGITAEDYRQIIGSAIVSSTDTGINISVYPRITYQNRIDIFDLFSGNLKFNGGDGLTATYYDDDSVYENTSYIFSGTPLAIDNFWEAGNFNYSGKIIPNAVNVNGGVQWEGYFVPPQTGRHVFYINSTACFTFDFEAQGYVSGINTYTEAMRVGITSTLSGVGTASQNSIFLNNVANVKHVAVGQSVSRTGIVPGTIIESVDRTTGVITLTPPEGTEFAITSGFNGNVVFFKTIGQDTSSYYTTQVLTKYRPYKIRARYFIPRNIDAAQEIRSINFDISYPTSDIGNSNLRYEKLYSLNYNFATAGKFPIYYDNSIDSGGGTLGGTTNSNNYVKVINTKPIDIKYQPKTSVSEIIKATFTGSTTLNSNVISVSDTTNIELGNYLFGSGIPDNSRVTEIIINETVVIDKLATATANVTLTAIDHRGFVQRSVGSGSGGGLTLSSGNTTNLRNGMIVIGSGIQAYTGITTTGSTSSITISPSQTIGAGTTLYFYQSRGLLDNALQAYCLADQTQCVIASQSIPAGSTTIQVTDSTKVLNGWNVYGAQFQSGTIISGAPPNATTIIINKPTISTINSGGNFTVTNQGQSKTLCCPPTDTSPPFDATPEGLRTVETAPNLRILTGDLVFDSLSAIVNPANITNYSTTDTSGCRISIKTPSGNFKILCA
jgi:hypothetical protein